MADRERDEIEELRFRQLKLIGRLSVSERAEILAHGMLPYYEQHSIAADALQRALLWKTLARMSQKKDDDSS